MTTPVSSQDAADFRAFINLYDKPSGRDWFSHEISNIAQAFANSKGYGGDSNYVGSLAGTALPGRAFNQAPADLFAEGQTKGGDLFDNPVQLLALAALAYGGAGALGFLGEGGLAAADAVGGANLFGDGLAGFSGASAGGAADAVGGANLFGDGLSGFNGGLGDASWGVNPQGGNMDWLDLISQVDGSGGVDWTTGLDTGAGDYSQWLNQLSDPSNPNLFPGESSTVGGDQSIADRLRALQEQFPNMPPGTTSFLSRLIGGGASGGSGSNTSKGLLGSLFGLDQGTASGLGALISGGLGAYASNQQTNAYKDLADKYAGYGAPYRQKLSDLMANPDSFLSSSEVQVPVQQGTNALMRSLSTGGNPFGSGNALQQGQNYASNNLYSQLQGKENQLAGFGGLTNYNGAAAGAAGNAIQSQGNQYNALGSSINDIFNPPKTLAENLAAYKSLIG
jgi:hypothetical protein